MQSRCIVCEVPGGLAWCRRSAGRLSSDPHAAPPRRVSSSRLRAARAARLHAASGQAVAGARLPECAAAAAGRGRPASQEDARTAADGPGLPRGGWLWPGRSTVRPEALPRRTPSLLLVLEGRDRGGRQYEAGQRLAGQALEVHGQIAAAGARRHQDRGRRLPGRSERHRRRRLQGGDLPAAGAGRARRRLPLRAVRVAGDGLH